MGLGILPKGHECGATMPLDIQNLTWLSSEGRQVVAEAFEALEHWQNEIRAANERCLTKVFDQVTNAHRASGWPEQVTNAAKEHFLKASSIQSQMIDQAMDIWQQQLKAQNSRSAAAGTAVQAPTRSPFDEEMHSSRMPLTSFNLWIEAAQAWQRICLSTMFGGALPRPPSMTSTQGTEPSMKGVDTIADEWRNFVSLRLREDVSFLQRLSQSTGPDQFVAAYAAFWRKAGEDYGNEIATMTKLVTDMASKTAVATKEGPTKLFN
jgi:Phasin protein